MTSELYFALINVATVVVGSALVLSILFYNPPEPPDDDSW